MSTWLSWSFQRHVFHLGHALSTGHSSKYQSTATSTTGVSWIWFYRLALIRCNSDRKYTAIRTDINPTSAKIKVHERQSVNNVHPIFQIDWEHLRKQLAHQLPDSVATVKLLRTTCILWMKYHRVLLKWRIVVCNKHQSETPQPRLRHGMTNQKERRMPPVDRVAIKRRYSNDKTTIHHNRITTTTTTAREVMRI